MHHARACLCSGRATVVTLCFWRLSIVVQYNHWKFVFLRLVSLCWLVGWLKAGVKRQITFDAPRSQIVWGSYQARQASLDYSIF